MTTFLVHSPVSATDLDQQLGRPEYSYAFVLARFRPVLERLGTVIDVANTDQIDTRYDACRAEGETCWFLCFAPPHRAPTGLRCPTTTVFAWEFETIPDHEWDGEPRNDWRTVLADHGRAIVLSRHTAAAVRETMGADFPVMAIPAPLFNHFTLPPLRSSPFLGPREVVVEGTVLDSREFTFTDEGMTAPALGARMSHGRWDGDRIDMGMRSGDTGPARLMGFYHSEPWGTWSRVSAPSVSLPVAVQGPVEIILSAHGLRANAGRTIEAVLGDQRVSFRLPARRKDIRLRFTPTQPATVLQFRGIRAYVPPGLDERTMGMGLTRVTIRRPSAVPPRLARVAARFADARPSLGMPDRPVSVTVDGVLYTSVLNPVDHRKNWPELLSAFCWAFRDEPRATLLLKMTHHSLAAYASDLQDVLHRVGPTKCRVLVVQGFLPDRQFERLMDATTYYANASSAEGLCMPLMEFMSAGVPAVATDNTAMADYLTPAAAFIVRSSPAYTHWPHDHRRLIRATQCRVDWESLAAAFRRSFDIATDDPITYAAMAAAARSSLAEFCSDDIVADALTQFLVLEPTP